jgi:hypothetical protein
VIPHAVYVDETNVDELREMDFVFLALDGGDAKRLIVEKLAEFGVNFVEVGMGVYENDSKLAGLLRTTASTSAKHAGLASGAAFVAAS